MERPYRHSLAKAQAVIHRLLPGASYEAFARIFAAACREARRLAPSSWEVTLEPGLLRLNVGPAAVLSAHPGKVFLCVTPLPVRPSPPIDYDYRGDKPIYPSVPVPSATLWCRPASLVRLSQPVREAHLAFVRQAAVRRSISAWRKAHSPAAVTVLGEAAGISIGQPAYEHGAVDAPDRDPEAEQALEDLFASREVEEAAIRLVTTALTQDGWRVTSVERDGVGYDLDCRRRGASLHVEVKGRRAGATVVVLTAKEWQRTLEDPAFRLAVVAYACSDRPQLTLWTGAEVSTRCDVEPIAFRARFREPAG